MSDQSPRLILYHQSHLHVHPRTGPISLLPLLTPHPTTSKPPITHLILSALHLNARPGEITYNDHPYRHPIHTRTFTEARTLQAAGIKVLILLGGAAGGAFTRLDGDSESFERYYGPFAEFLRWSRMDGVDLDVEEPTTSLPGIVRLIVRLKADFGRGFIITLAPVATAMLEPPRPNPDFGTGRRREGIDAVWKATKGAGVGNLSGFSYAEVEMAVGSMVDWYNVQFYCGWGSLWPGRGRGGVEMYRAILERGGWDPRRVVVGTVTNTRNGAGWVPERVLRGSLAGMMGVAWEVCDARGWEVETVPFGGVMGWEYYNAAVQGGNRGLGLVEDEPWRWAGMIREVMESFGGEDTWDERATIWDGKFGEERVGIQERSGKWR